MRMKGAIAARAKERQGTRTDLNISQKLDESPFPIRTDEELAKLAGISRTTIRHAETILRDGTEEQKARARVGGKGRITTSFEKNYIYPSLCVERSSTIW